MPSRFQFETVMKLLSAGVDNYVQIRQQAGLTSDELDDILEHIPEYKQKFAEEDRKAEEARLKAEKKPWWRRK
jgi:hypothetical protein